MKGSSLNETQETVRRHPNQIHYFHNIVTKTREMNGTKHIRSLGTRRMSLNWKSIDIKWLLSRETEVRVLYSIHSLATLQIIGAVVEQNSKESYVILFGAEDRWSQRKIVSTSCSCFVNVRFKQYKSNILFDNKPF